MTPRRKKVTSRTPEEYAKMIREAAKVGNAQFEFFVAYGRLPTKDDDLSEFIVESIPLNE